MPTYSLSSLSERSTLVDLLTLRVAQPGQSPDNPVFTFLETGIGAGEIMTFASLDRRARSIAAHLQESVRTGDRVLLVYPPGLEFIAAFWGCVYAGAVAVPALPATNARTMPRLHAIVTDAQPSMALVSASVAGRMGRASRETDSPLGAISWLATDDLPDASAHWQRPDLPLDHLAFLQYTSGSTGLPKGVMVSHGNVLANVEALEHACGLKSGDTFVSWLPHYHDMGLIWGILSPLYTGYHCVQFPASAFLARPYRWLKLISDYRARITSAPNFAYELCIAKVGDELKASLDLSSLEVAANGAEPIRADTLRRFSAAFAECGFRRQSFCPGYGLAEATLMVSINTSYDDGKPAILKLSKTALENNRVELAQEDEDVVEIVSTGPVNAKHHAVIVDPVSLTRRSEREVGEVWLCGPSITQGYWNHQEETLRTFAARSEGDDHLYLRTGDLGFLHHDELYVVGRLKEMMIFQGRNIYPQDVEAAVEKIDSAFRAHGGAVFSLDEGGATQLVVLQELEFRAEPNWEGLANRIRAAIAEEFEIYDVAAIVLVKAGWIPRTTSGKIQRLQCKALFEKQAIDAIWEWRKNKEGRNQDDASGVPRRQPCTETERTLALLWRELLHVTELDASDNFFESGGQSILATQLLSRIRDVFRVEVDVQVLFESPTLEGLATRIDALWQVSLGVPLSHIPKSNRDCPLPLSYAQEGIWLSDQTEEKNASYHNALSFRLEGELDVPALIQTFNQIVQRHEALRTRFVASDGIPLQIIAPQMRLEVPVFDWSCAADQRRERTGRLIKEVVQTPFDLTSGPMLRASIVQLQPQEYLLLINVHHIVSDGWSMGVLVREISALYTASVKGTASPLNELPVQYADYSQWQREWLDSGVLRQQLDYWKGQLRGAPALLELPTDYRRPLVQGFGGAQAPFAVSGDTVQGVEALARQERATLFMAVAAVFATLLWRYSGQDDICIGTPVANRGRSETEPLIGCFVNTLVLRTRPGANARFLDLLRQVRVTALEAFAHQDAPFELVVQAINPHRNTSHSPLFQTMLVFQNAPLGKLDLSGLSAQLERLASGACRFDLQLEVAVDDEGRLQGYFEYKTGLFAAGSMARMAERFQRFLETIVETPETRLDELPMLSQAEREQVLYGWNRTEREYPGDRCIHELFEEQAERTPGATAVAYEGATLSYGELNRRANQLGHYLRKLGVGPDERVALCVERSMEMMVGLLAVLKAGGAYVPLDPAYPQERQRFMLEDSAPVALLTQAHLRKRFPDGSALPVMVDVSGDGALWEQMPGSNLSSAGTGLTSGHLAYVIYTSGSTGTPKGVMMSQRALLNLLHWQGNALAGMHKTLQFAALGFDVAAQEMLTTLCAGKCLVFISTEQRQDPHRTLECVQKEKIETLFLPFVALHHLAETRIDPQAMSALIKDIITAGEQLQLSGAIRNFIRSSPGCRLHNQYGPTETHVATSFTMDGDPESWPALPPIGRPIANTQIYILDDAREPVPVAITGEIYIGGAGVARGYLNRPELTAERFVPDPFAQEPGARMYKTGDMGRWLADGNIEFLGRNDFQVKIRGFRIELGEIEARLREHEGLREAVVMAREDEPGDKRLVAYYTVKEDGDAVSVEELREHLLARLPEYMAPSGWVQLEALPLTPNGKLDRKALPAPAAHSYAGRGYEAPQGELENQIAQIWARILKLEKVGRHDNFFAVGGHSLLAVRLASRLWEAFDVDVPINEIFARPVLSSLAEYVLDKQSSHQSARVGPIPRAERSGALPLSFAQQRLWLLAQLQGLSRAYHIPAGFRLAGTLDQRALRRALNRIVERHEALRTTFHLVDGEPVQRIAGIEESNFTLIEQDLRGQVEAERELDRIIGEEAAAEFDLENGPLIRGRLIRLQNEDEEGEERHALLLTMHHIVSDGWSMEVLGEELSALYGAYQEGKEDPLPELEIQYGDYAVWQRRRMEGELLRGQAEYWKSALAGAPAVLELPTERPRPGQQDYAGALVEVVLDEELTAGLKRVSQLQGVTLYMTLLAGWAAVLSRLSGQTEVVIGTPTANRGHGQVEKLIGFFVNMLALRVDLSGSPTGKELLERVKRQTVAAQANQDIPFEQVVELVHPVRSTAYTPVFQAMFGWESTPPEALALRGLRVLPLRGEALNSAVRGAEAEALGAKFDLTLGLREQGGKIAGGFIYATALYERGTIERHAEYLRNLLQGLVADASALVEQLPMLPAAEWEQVLYAWNRTQAEYRRDRCVHELFEEQAERTPGATAVVYEGVSLSYRELNRRANQLGHYLRKLGVGPDERVALCVERGREMMVGLLAVLKAGAAYVPLDPTYPRERLLFMLEDSAPVALLTQGRLRALFAGHELTIPVIELEWEKHWENLPEGNPDQIAGFTARHPVYVIYTSGSAGAPKGVIVEHRSVVNLLDWTQRTCQLSAEGAVLQNAPFGFDASVTGFFWPLVMGARVVMAPPEGHKDAAYLCETIRRNGVTAIGFPISMLPVFAETIESRACSTLAHVMCGGEALPGWVVRQFQERLPQVQLHNLYGPTEATVASTAWTCSAKISSAETCSKKDELNVIPIGKPIANTYIYILDRAGEPVPVGVTGEIYIGGVGVARGYLNRPELTAERFVPDPFAGEPGARVYKTGDLGRWLADGNIEFGGRNDFQVKIRGFRIELGEIEARLREHAGVGEAVVIAREDKPEDKWLVAYYTASHVGEEVSVEGLRAHLLTTLPEYMVPSGWVQLEALPLTPNGKLDRKALPLPAAQSFADRYEEPQGEIETQIAQIWAEILKLEQVGRHDNFFEVGGHSLLGVRMISRLRQVSGRAVEIQELFSHPVLRDLAKAMEEAARSGQEVIPRADRSGALPLSFGQQRMWFRAQLEGLDRAFHIPGGFLLAGALDRGALRRALNRIVERHEVLRTTFQLVDGEPVQRIAGIEESKSALIEQDLRGHQDGKRELQQIVREEARAEFDLERGPLIRGRLIQLEDEGGAERHALLLTVHHIVSDGWSMGIMGKELSALYEAYRAGEEDPLPDLEIQYGDYAVWQRQRLKGELLKRQAEYWKETLAGVPAVLELPTDHPRPRQQDYAGAVVEVMLDEDLTAALKELSQRRGVTLYMTLLAAWAAVLSRLSGQTDVVIGTPNANRGHVQLERLIGFFVNNLVVRVDLSGSPTGEELLERVKRQTVGAQANQDIPFDQVVELVHPVRSTAHSPVFQAMFAWQNAPRGRFAFAGLQVMPLRGEGYATAKFDLTLGLREQDEKIVGELTYATALYERETMERHVEYLRNLLRGLVGDESAQWWSDCRWCPAAEPHQR